MHLRDNAASRFQAEPLLAVILWGGIYPGAKLGLQELPVLSFTALRIVIAVVVLFLVSGLAARSPLVRPMWKPLVAAGLAQMAFQGLLVLGLQRTTAGNSAILLAVAPLLTAVWLALTGRTRFAQRQWLGLALGLVGVVLVVRSAGVDLSGAQLIGNLIALGAAAAWAWYGLAIGPLVASVGPMRATGWTMLAAGLLFVPLSLPELRALPWTSVSLPAWAGLVYGATLGMVVAMALWGKSVHRLGPQRTMVYAYLEPVSAVAIAAVLLGESLSPIQAAGALLAFAGIWLAS